MGKTQAQGSTPSPAAPLAATPRHFLLPFKRHEERQAMATYAIRVATAATTVIASSRVEGGPELPGRRDHSDGSQRARIVLISSNLTHRPIHAGLTSSGLEAVDW
ncbi:hypothetical protein ETD86_36180 [Nonomuraea turkmeniaca]|uniref:Uncharacterized protein n=1 Tax=Nonomuraea turkmeniaca TaxID=103838 RepID=A0A5S4F5C2_9ACTN|nr:hypothetical protein [Nonomuraea turkmeniaca]TMR11319.1 hypothetical protein ETD86_36180 [Nonomuraea turkmeniaca]